MGRETANISLHVLEKVIGEESFIFFQKTYL